MSNKTKARKLVDVDHLAKLAKLNLSPKEKKTLKQQLEETIKYIKILQELKTDSISPTSQVTGQKNLDRADQPKRGLTPTTALANASRQKNGYFVTPRVKWE